MKERISDEDRQRGALSLDKMVSDGFQFAGGSGPEGEARRNEVIGAVAGVVSDLPSHFSELVAMLCVCEGNVREVARRMNLPHMTVANRVARLRKELLTRGLGTN